MTHKLAREDYVTLEHGVVVEVRCKLCGVHIAGRQFEDAGLRTIKGRTVAIQRPVFKVTNQYREGYIEFEDGSVHVTPICAGCAPKLADADTAAAVYAADVAQWAREGRKPADGDKRKVSKLRSIEKV